MNLLEINSNQHEKTEIKSNQQNIINNLWENTNKKKL